MTVVLSRRDLGWAALGGLATACARTYPAARSTVRIAIDSVLESMDPLMTINEYPLFRAIFDALTYVDANGMLQPRLATGWASNSDATEWTFALRRDARWSDGAPVTVEDVLFSFERVSATPTSLNHQYLADVRRLEAIGEGAVRFHLGRPFSAWPQQLTLLSIVPRRVYQRLGPAEFSMRPVSSGPYRIAEWDAGSNASLRANPYYWGTRPSIREAVVVSIPDETARLNAMQAGDVDAMRISPHRAMLLDRYPGIALERARSNRVVYLGFDVRHSVLEDLRIRRAIDLAVDRAGICRYLLRGAAAPIGQLVAPNVFGYAPGIAPTAFDPAAARALLAAAEYDGAPISFRYPSDGAIPLTHYVAEAIGGQLAAVGLNIVMRGSEQSAFIADWATGKLDGLWMFAFNPSTMDAGLVSATLIGRGGIRSFEDPALDALEADQLRETDPTRRLASFAAIWRRVQDRAWYAPLFNDEYVYAYARDRVRFPPRRDGYLTPQEFRSPR